MHVLDTIGRSLADGGGMFWQTLWALVLGFGLSGVVQAFVSRAEMQRALGDRRPATIARAGFFGAISSSCSYAASALAKTLFARGADFTAAQAFMFASTNLVAELGIMLWLLIGWQFAAAEFTGGALMIALLTLVLPRVVSPGEQEAARAALAGGTAGDASGAYAGHGDTEPGHEPGSWRARIRSLAGWSEAAGYTISDLTMLRKELVTGFIVAGFADAAVPVSFWRSLFLTGHGFWSVAENVVLGPFLAVISFVCSIGNVPLAAALWTGGITFGGTIAFVFADLITLPLLLIYRRYYGTRLTLKLLAVFWATMSAAGLVTEYLFTWAGIAPGAGPRHAVTGQDVWGWNYTAFLNIAALAAFAGLYWLNRNRERLGGGAGYAKDPVCGMQVTTAHAPATASFAGTAYYFCSDHCQHKFTASPDRYAGGGLAAPAQDTAQAVAVTGQATGSVTDPVCGMTVDPATAAARARYAGQEYYFCSEGCARHFTADPLAALTNAPDPVCGMTVRVADAQFTARHDGVRYIFCGPGCRERFTAGAAEPARRH
ncbi:MAG: permease [Actinomycetota bacterium]|nr:permease [Actinomycetota bacterium]